MTAPSVPEQLRILRGGTVHCISEDELTAKLTRGGRLRVKLGIDPTASDIHLGFAVVLRKLRQFQELGHVAVLIIGDFTARVGDPSGRSATRPGLSGDEINGHAATYLEQVRKILDFSGDRIEVHRNSTWLQPLDMEQVLRMTSRVTVARMLERNDFAHRYAAGNPIALMELLYPLLQGLDSVQVRADVELGGTDQLFNNLMGRQLQEHEGQEPQVVLTTPLLEGLDGVQKMSKSLGNFVGITEPPNTMFGKLMKIPDELMPRYFELTTGWHPDRVSEVQAELSDTDPLGRNRLKRLLARTVVELYHGPEAGQQAEAEFDRVFKAHEAPTDIEEFEIPASEFAEGRIPVARLLALTRLAGSNRAGRQKISEGAVSLDGGRVTDPYAEVTPPDVDGRVLQMGKRAWARIRVS